MLSSNIVYTVDTFMTAGEPEPDSGKHHDHGSSWEPHIVIGPVHFGAWHDVPAGVTGSYLCQYQAERSAGKRSQRNRSKGAQNIVILLK